MHTESDSVIERLVYDQIRKHVEPDRQWAGVLVRVLQVRKGRWRRESRSTH